MRSHADLLKSLNEGEQDFAAAQNEPNAKQGDENTLAADARLARNGQGHEGRRRFD
jgi:hypothetical protein